MLVSVALVCVVDVVLVGVLVVGARRRGFGTRREKKCSHKSSIIEGISAFK